MSLSTNATVKAEAVADLLAKVFPMESPEKMLPREGVGWDAMSEDEKRFEALRKEQIIREKDEELKQAKDIHGLRKWYLGLSFGFVAVFASAALTILILCGSGVLELNTTVLVTLLTTTMANVIGILAIAFKWLFPRK